MKSGDLVKFRYYREGILGILLKKYKNYKRFHYDEWVVLIYDGEQIVACEEIDFYLVAYGTKDLNDNK